jgi:hypothetical protein
MNIFNSEYFVYLYCRLFYFTYNTSHNEVGYTRKKSISFSRNNILVFSNDEILFFFLPAKSE